MTEKLKESKNEKIVEFKPETIPEFKLIEDAIPGLTEDKLDAGISIRGIAPVKTWTGYHLKTTADGAGDLKITIGFKPKSVHIFSIYQAGADRRSEESTSWTTEDNSGNLTTTTTYRSEGSPNNKTFTSGAASLIDCVYVFRDATRFQTFNMGSFDSDGFTLTSNGNGTSDVGMHIFAIG